MSKRAQKVRISKYWAVTVLCALGLGVVATVSSSTVQKQSSAGTGDVSYDCLALNKHKTTHGWPLAYETMFDYKANPYLPCHSPAVREWLPFAGDVAIFSGMAFVALWLVNKIHWGSSSWAKV